MKISAAIAGAALAAGLLTACGGSGSGAYCDDLKSAQTQFKDLDQGNFAEAFETFDDLAAEAPDEVKGDWETMTKATDTFKKALSDAGLSMDDLQKLQEDPTNLPEGVDVSKLSGLTSELSKLNSDEFKKASENIEKHAKDECDVELS